LDWRSVRGLAILSYNMTTEKYCGRDLPDVIKRLLEDESRDDKVKLEKAIAEKSQGFLTNYGLDTHAGEVFDLFRRLDRECGDKQDDRKKRLKAFKSIIDSWGGQIPEHSHESLYEALMTPYLVAKSELFKSRSKLAHVAAVMRPLRRNHIDQWASALHSRFNLELAVAKADELNGMPIRSTADVEFWQERVYSHFAEIAVVDKYSLGADAKKPAGMIGIGSLRTYKVQWKNWMTRERCFQIFEAMSQSEAGSGGNFYADDSRMFNPASRDMGFASLAAPSRNEDMLFAAAPSISRVGVAVTIRKAEDQSPVAESRWNDKESALNNVEGWLTATALGWGEQLSVSVEIVFTNESGENKLNLPPKTLGELGSTLPRLITTLN
ncbi:MAG: hypothetical protein RIS26_67, partial [Actinomycetota bacterium]